MANIKKRVQEAINQRIKDGQKEFDEKVVELDQSMAEAIRAITDSNKVSKSELEDSIVLKILG